MAEITETAMSGVVSYSSEGPIAEVRLDDGKVNVLTRAVQLDLLAALDRAEGDGQAVVIAGRPGVFSAGFDLATLRAGGEAAFEMVIGGFELARRVLSFPRPVVMACTGHAVAMGSFLLLSGDLRVGSTGPHQLVANEVAIGLTMPYTATELLRQRLTPAAFQRALLLAEVFGPDDAVAAGFLDEVVDADDVIATAHERATRAAGLDPTAFAASKLRARGATLEALDAAIELDRQDLRAFL
jgi:enoyl-CoA hydratase